MVPLESPPARRYEDHAYVLDFDSGGRSSTVRGRGGPIASAVGESRLMLLELLGEPGAAYAAGERVYVGREGGGEGRAASVLGRLRYEALSPGARAELPGVVEKIVASTEARFVAYVNGAQALTPRVHALELIPGIGRKHTRAVLEERERERFSSYADIRERAGISDPAGHISQRILEEMAGGTRMNLFVGR